MFRIRTGAAARALAAGVIALGAGLASAPPALAHGDANCSAFLKEDGTTYQNQCILPFQGYPIGVAAVFRPNADDPTPKPSEIHAEILLKTAFGPTQSLSMECYDPAPAEDGTTPVVYGTTHCKKEWNDPVAGQQFSLVEAIPTEVVSLQCTVHSHARYSRRYPPMGEFACWSTNEAREDLEADGVMAEIDAP